MKSFVSAVTAVAVVALGLGGAATFDVRGAEASPAACDGYARNQANKAAGGSAVATGLFGAIAGAAIGGIAGGRRGAGTGALIGGAGGAVVGGSTTWQATYNKAYNECMAQSISVSGPIPPVGSPAWYYQCSTKYKSFNSNPNYPGYYLGFDGQYHVCQLP